MAETPTPLWFKITILAGVLLAVLVLVQTVAGYWFLSGALVLQEGRRGAERTVRALQTAIRFSGATNGEDIATVLEELREGSSDRIAWIAIRDADGAVYASSTGRDSDPFSLADIERALTPSDEPGLARVERLDRGPDRAVVVGLVPCRCVPPSRPFRFGGDRRDGAPAEAEPSAEETQNGAPQPPPGAGPPRFRYLAEVAIFRDSVSAPFGPLRRVSIINGSAAVALLAALLVIGTRFRDYIRGRQLELQLQLARQVQRDLLPPAGRQPPNVDFAAHFQPAAHVGGDFYDVTDLGEGRVAFVLGDVSGHGMSAALLMALVHGAVSTGRWDGPVEGQELAMRRLNELLLVKSSEERYATLFWCAYDAGRGVLQYINAGHVPPLLLRRRASQGFDVERLKEGGPVLGVLPDARYHQGQVKVGEGDRLVILSDGIVEATNARREEFGEARVLAAVESAAPGTAESIRDRVMEQVRAFSTGPRLDDQTILVITLQGLQTSTTSQTSKAATTRRPPLPLSA